MICIRLSFAFAPLGVPIGARPWRPDSFTPLRTLTPAQRCRRRDSAHGCLGFFLPHCGKEPPKPFPCYRNARHLGRGIKKTPLSSRAYIQQGPLGSADQNKISCLVPGSAEASLDMYACEGKVRCRAINGQQKSAQWLRGATVRMKH